MDAVFDWLEAHDQLLIWLVGLSIGSLVATAVLVPLFVVRIPEHYFARGVAESRTHRPRTVAGWFLAVGKNLLGGVFVLAGIAMLVLPGQGILTILVGLLLMDFPGKQTLERGLVRRPAVLRVLNWMRRKAGKPPLRV